jgi:hypothetical protein
MMLAKRERLGTTSTSVDSMSTTSRVDYKALVFTVFMNKCLESTLELTLMCLIDYFIKTSPLVFSDRLNRDKLRGFGQIVGEFH